MATLNRLPMEIIHEHEEIRAGVHGCTDITGFGLFGHLHEMAEASGVSIHLDKKKIADYAWGI
jgi:selenide, water dikinase